MPRHQETTPSTVDPDPSTAPANGPGPEPLIGPSEAPAVHVMSFNVRVGSDGLHDPWADRRAATAAVLRSQAPTVIGTQEGLYHQLRDISADLPTHYEWIGTGREGGSRGEFMAVFFDVRRLDPREFDHFWLSDTPAEIGSSSWGNKVVRMATWIRFRDRVTGRDFVVLNTHLDHAVDKAQRLGAELVAERLAAFDPALPVIVTGDFNVAAEASTPYDTLTTGAGLVDTWSAANDRLTPAYATYHGYEPAVEGGDRIDWILVRPDTRVQAAAINTRTVDGRWGSDHWPVQALLALD
ncbi:endonuclease/exonuclease/phosphatase family protein [Actinopolymorpha sp. B11F2]|uniref:endonuclease/exonuclease/phosphatase family protein n=1 Tax=Actinopolymorpha sp. B11F2 TaxID=3160862 RepID=UPI0032E4CE63